MANAKTSNNLTMEELLASQSKTLGLTRGQEIEGTIILLTDKEIMLDLGTKSDGILPARDLDGLDKLKVGDKLKAFVVEPENESGQVVLAVQKSVKPVSRSRNQSGNDLDWDKISQKYQHDQIAKGVVTKVTQFGVFVQLEEGLEGLIHVSKLGPEDEFKSGEAVSVTIDSVDPDKRRISLVPVITSTKGLIYK